MTEVAEPNAGIHIEAALAAGMSVAGDDRSALFSDGVVAAALLLEALGIGPYPVSFLAGCVRSMGLAAARELPEPLPDAAATGCVRAWMVAARDAAGPNVAADDLFARWLTAVAAVLALRRRATTQRP